MRSSHIGKVGIPAAIISIVVMMIVPLPSMLLDLLIAVNIACEGTKCGTTATAVFDLVRQVSLLPHLRVRGLMTMPPFFADPEGARPYFRELRRIAGEVAAENIPRVEMKELSMGMSGDFEVAIAEGATLVRVGSAIFGERV